MADDADPIAAILNRSGAMQSGLFGDALNRIPKSLRDYDASIDSTAGQERDAYNRSEGALSGMADQRATILGGLGAGLLMPTKGGTFGESLGRGMAYANDAYEKNRTFQMDRNEKIQTLQIARAKLAQEAALAHQQSLMTQVDLAGKLGTAAQGVAAGMGTGPLMQIQRSDPPVAPGPGADAGASAAPPGGPAASPAPTADAGAAAVPPGAGAPPAQAVASAQPDPDAPDPGAAEAGQAGTKPGFVIPGNPPDVPGAGNLGQQQLHDLWVAKQQMDWARQHYPPAMQAPFKERWEKALEQASGSKEGGYDVDFNSGKLVPTGKNTLDAIGAAEQAKSKGQELGKNDLDVQLAKGATEMQGDADKGIKSYRPMMNTFNGMEDAFTKLEPGALASEKGATQAFLKALGAPLPNTAGMNAEDAEKANKYALSQVLTTYKETGGRMLKAELQLIEKANPNSNMQPGAVRSIIGGLKAATMYDRQEALAWNDYVDSQRAAGKSVGNASSWRARYEDANPFDEFKAKATRGIAIRGAPLSDPSKVEAGDRENINGVPHVYVGQPGHLKLYPEEQVKAAAAAAQAKAAAGNGQ